MQQLGSGLSAASHNEDALSVKEAELSMEQRLGASECDILVVKGNLAGTYRSLGRFEECSRMQRDVYFGRLKLDGKEHKKTHTAVNNYAASLFDLQRFEEARSILRKTIPVVRRVHGEDATITLRMRWAYAIALYQDAGATLDDLREAVTTLEDIEQTARRVLGSAHPDVAAIENNLQNARAALHAREV